MDGGEKQPFGGSIALACVAATAAALLAVGVCFALAELVSRPLGVVAGFAAGSFVIASRGELAAGLAGARHGGFAMVWLGLLGILVAAGTPLLGIAV